MKINYDLSGKNGSLPLIPVPHDCIVEHITETENACLLNFPLTYVNMIQFEQWV